MDKQNFALLYRKYLAGTCTPEETERFHRWLLDRGSEEMLRELLQETYAGIRQHSATLVDAAGNLVASPGTGGLPQLLRKRKKRRAINLTLIAGIALLLAVGGRIAWQYRAPKQLAATPPTRTWVTARAEYRRLVLPDSSIVWLNAGSRLDFPARFGAGTREVTLTGEASFDIRHAAEHPFLIHTGRIVTRVLGTAFNINAYPDRHSVTISVSRGRVQVSRGDETLATLTRGQQVRVNSEDSARPLRRTIAVASVADWQNGNLDYDDQTLAEVVADLSRVFDSEIRIASPKLRDMRISTRLRRDEGLPQALEILGKLTESRVIVRGNKYMLQ